MGHDTRFEMELSVESLLDFTVNECVQCVIVLGRNRDGSQCLVSVQGQRLRCYVSLSFAL